MALMAKAGLFLPVAASDSRPRMEWFDAVLADVGDSQDLQQSLSTFSGHVKRLGRILAAISPRSLVLLDEVRLCQLVTLCAGQLHAVAAQCSWGVICMAQC